MLRNIVVMDVLYESYLDKKREAQKQMSGDGKRVLSHISINEGDLTLYELFDDGEIDDVFNEEVAIEGD